jgi:hypothetical protein
MLGFSCRDLRRAATLFLKDLRLGLGDPFLQHLPLGVVLPDAELEPVCAPTRPHAPIREEEQRMVLPTCDVDHAPPPAKRRGAERGDERRRPDARHVLLLLLALFKVARHDPGLAVVVQPPCVDFAAFVDREGVVVPAAYADNVPQLGHHRWLERCVLVPFDDAPAELGLLPVAPGEDFARGRKSDDMIVSADYLGEAVAREGFEDGGMELFVRIFWGCVFVKAEDATCRLKIERLFGCEGRKEKSITYAESTPGSQGTVVTECDTVAGTSRYIDCTEALVRKILKDHGRGLQIFDRNVLARVVGIDNFVGFPAKCVIVVDSPSPNLHQKLVLSSYHVMLQTNLANLVNSEVMHPSNGELFDSGSFV